MKYCKTKTLITYQYFYLQISSLLYIGNARNTYKEKILEIKQLIKS